MRDPFCSGHANAPIIPQSCSERALLFSLSVVQSLVESTFKILKGAMLYVFIFRNNIKSRDWGKSVLLYSEALGTDVAEAALKAKGKQGPALS